MPESSIWRSAEPWKSPLRRLLKIQKRSILAESDEDEGRPTAAPNEGKLLNEAWRKTEACIDKLHELFIGGRQKPRSYRRKVIGQQLRFIKRNLAFIAHCLE